MKEFTIQIPDGKKAEWVDGVLTLVNDPKDNRPITERVKTFEDACEVLGDEHPFVKAFNDAWNNTETLGYDMYAYLELRIIVAALNEGWKPTFIKSEKRWFPWFLLWTADELKDKDKQWIEPRAYLDISSKYVGDYPGFVFVYPSYSPSDAVSNISPHLCLRTEALAEYCGKQFIDIWAEFYLTPHIGK